ncbi:MAG: hypothetical protein ACI4EA_00745 [Candidatus Ornithomonoglobus sp.]
MFANLMNTEEKENFLQLIFKIANCDGEYQEEEDELIQSYKSELNLSDIKDTKSIEELITYFSEKTDQIKKIVFFELYGMIMADGVIADEEQHILNLVKSGFNLGEEIYTQIISAADDLQKIYNRIYDVLF